MRTLALGLLLVTLAFAGCLSGDDDPEPSTSSTTTSTSQSSTTSTSSTTTTSSSSTSTSTAPSNANTVPTGTLGALPQNLTVVFALNGTDPDGDALNWTLSFGDASTNATGAQLPTIVNHTYAAVGLYEVEFVLDDGTNQTSYNVTLNLTAGALPGPYVFTGTATGVSEPLATGARAYGDDVDHTFAVPGGATGLHALLAWEVGGPVATDLDLYIYDGTGSERGRSACANTGPVPDPVGFFPCPRGNDEEITVAGVIPTDAGTWKATVAPFEAQMTEYTLTITLS